jgi:hypothetical protein
MKKLTSLLAIILLLVGFGCATQQALIDPRTYTDFEKVHKEKFGHLSTIHQAIFSRGYITVDELQEMLSSLESPIVRVDIVSIWPEAAFRAGYCGPVYWPDISSKANDIIDTVITKDLLPFEAMFYLTLEKENYDEAELIRMNWVNCLNDINEKCKNEVSKIMFGKVPSSPILANKNEFTHMLRPLLNCSKTMTQRIYYQIERLTSVVGLTDPVLVTLRKELINSLKDKKWDDVQKLQDLITTRTDELKPPHPQVIHTDVSGGQTTVVVERPSEQHIKVEKIPRYGATDVGRAISLLQGKGEDLTDKEAGTLKLIDILLKR